MAMNILAPVDFSDVTDAVVAHAERLAKAFDGTVLLLHVAPHEQEVVGYVGGATYVPTHAAEGYRAERERLAQYEQALAQDGVRCESIILEGAPHAHILDEARHRQADWIVLGSHGHGALHHLLMGSVCESVMKHADCPITIVPARVLSRRQATPGEAARA